MMICWQYCSRQERREEGFFVLLHFLCHKTSLKKILMRGRIYFSSQLQITVLQCEEVQVGTEATSHIHNQKQTENECIHSCDQLVPLFFYRPGPKPRGRQYPHLGCVYPHQTQSRQCPTNMPTGQINRNANSSIILSSQAFIDVSS